MQTWEEKLASECGLTAQASQCRKVNPNPELVWQEVYQSIGRGSKANYPFLKRKRVKSAGPGGWGREFKHWAMKSAVKKGALHSHSVPLEPQFSEEPSWQLLPPGSLASAQCSGLANRRNEASAPECYQPAGMWFLQRDPSDMAAQTYIGTEDYG